MDEMRTWENRKGIAFLKRVGVKPGYTVVDFGCRVGHYSIPAAILVGPDGRVYAIDKDGDALNRLNEKASASGLTNLRTVETAGETDLDLPDVPVDVFLLYDVLHLIEKDRRTVLYSQIRQSLGPGAILSVYPKHIATDSPSYHFKDLNMADVTYEVEEAGFLLEARICGTISHDDSLVGGCTLNFRKK